MPAPFLSSLCGYREGRPNTSDKNDKGSIELGSIFYETIGIPPHATPPTKAVGNLMGELMSADLQKALQLDAPHLAVEPERPFTSFEQFSHLNAARELRGDMAEGVVRTVNAIRNFSKVTGLEQTLQHKLIEHLDRIQEEVKSTEDRRRELLDLLGEESLLRLDITVSREIPNAAKPTLPLQHLVAGLSLKWTLRTDRAQDCRSQGSKMAALRRGRMPHFAAVTMEPRPSMLALLGRGSGDVDCVYHLHLPALAAAIDEYCSGSQSKARQGIRDNFKRLCDQRRIRDYDDLRSYVATL
ncbi:NgoMIV family type II restriction endonuclease [Streptomyces sp. NPDC002402]